jgi:hypothetical protein
MWGEPRQARSATMAIIYITAGALLDVWSVIYYIYLERESAHPNMFLLCYGLFGSGAVLLVVGLLVGQIGRASRAAEVVGAPPAQIVTPVNNVPAPPAVVAPTEPAEAKIAPPMNSRAVPASPPAAPPVRTSAG